MILPGMGIVRMPSIVTNASHESGSSDKFMALAVIAIAVLGQRRNRCQVGDWRAEGQLSRNRRHYSASLS